MRARLHREFLSFTEVKPPFNRVIHFSLTAMPQWGDAESVDLAQHLFFHKLPTRANGRQALFDFVAKLHEPMLDRSRPLWELHVIDGLVGGRFALYQKMHHAYADGVTMARWTARGPERIGRRQRQLQPIWTVEHSAYAKQREPAQRRCCSRRWNSSVGAASAAGHRPSGRDAAAGKREADEERDRPALRSTARTPLTGQVSAGRQFASTDRVDGACGRAAPAHTLHR